MKDCKNAWKLKFEISLNHLVAVLSNVDWEEFDNLEKDAIQFLGQNLEMLSKDDADYIRAILRECVHSRNPKDQVVN